MPWIYHPYAGHDNNRDWFMFNLSETRAITKVLYHDWFPQIHIDEHQMGSDDARLFVPPFMNPPVPNVQPLVWRGVNLFGANMAYDLQKNGYRGVVHGRSFTGWWIGACDDTGWLHNNDQPPQRSGLGQPRDAHLHRAHRDPQGLRPEAHGVPRPVARRLVAAEGHRGLRADAVHEPRPDGLPPQGGSPPQLPTR